jgi:hypothetical protein
MRWADFTKYCAYRAREARDHDPDPDRADRDLRHVSLHDGLRGTGLLSGELTPVAKATVRAALERVERDMFEADWVAARAEHGDATTTAHLPAPTTAMPAVVLTTHNGHACCGPHNRQGEHPPPSGRRPVAERTLEERAATLQLIRARIVDRVRHDPAWGYVAVDDPWRPRECRPDPVAVTT